MELLLAIVMMFSAGTASSDYGDLFLKANDGSPELTQKLYGDLFGKDALYGDLFDKNALYGDLFEKNALYGDLFDKNALYGDLFGKDALYGDLFEKLKKEESIRIGEFIP